MQFIIATHGELAAGIASSLKILLGDKNNIHTVNAFVDETNFQEMLDTLIFHQFAEEQILLMTDLYGGSINQYAVKFLSDRVRVVSGINLALVLELVTAGEPDDDDIEAAIRVSQKQMLYVNRVVAQKQEAAKTEEDFF